MAVPADFLPRAARTRRFTLGLPTGIRVAADGTVLFVRSAGDDPVSRLYAVDPGTGEESLLADPFDLLAGAAEDVPPEERARRERLRQRTTGITAFHLCSDDRRVVIPLAGRVFVLDRDGGEVREVQAPSPAIDPRPSPDGLLLACVSDGDVHVVALDGGVAGTPLTHRDTEDVTYGLAEYVAQEEMDRLEGFWWAPDSARLAVARVDTADVERWHLADQAHPERPPVVLPFPRPGRANASVDLLVLPAAGGAHVEVRWDRDAFPYLAKVVWSDNAPLTLLVQDRLQKKEQVLTVDADTGACAVLLEEVDPAWLNLPAGPLRWLPDGTAFAWISEVSGWPVLELVTRDGARRPVTAPGLGLRALLALDQAAAVVTCATEPAECHVARVGLADGTVTLLSRDPGVHGWAGTAATGVLVSRTLTTGARYVVCRDGGPDVALCSEAMEPGLDPVAELVTVGERELRAVVVRPGSLAAGDRLPVLLDVYGGPHVQYVQASRDAYLMHRWLAEHGFVVVSVDGRGTPGRGRDWERAIAGDFATVPLADQVEALAALGARFPEMDLARVVVRGWSFGGYLAALAVLRRPDVFCGAVAGAPVTDWLDYDTHYTERYLGLPTANPDGYRHSGLLDTAAAGLTRPLLLIHGTADDNVFFSHTLKLSHALFRAGAPHEVLPLSDLTHMADDVTATVRLWERTAAFLQAAVR